MYQVGQRVVTDLGVGDILRVEHERYYVLIDFPSNSTHSYEEFQDRKKEREKRHRHPIQDTDQSRRMRMKTTETLS